ncbi:Oidioi.mRNA.OKI2018_I69.XSR.g15442.t1.cds [Oikopleura dioica]|uniref:Oidioi.mRNA.OKI2018_I69.XSR.g15442.t1.cds n=1 Tax=Oikopleura dioica TaxID=34765 RepID=A0ABN7SHZ9_OIKDI|nr:Oidioi.mRNA.OKI2018_I69.XSR.g15442.t1.cds [Oikopleura dioica]
MQSLQNDYLLELEQMAPNPRARHCRHLVDSRPSYFGLEYHGKISRERASILCRSDGEFLIRECSSDASQHILVLRCNGEIKNYRLFFDEIDHLYSVGEKSFENVIDLVRDGLIHLFIENRAKSYIDNMEKTSVYVDIKRAIESEEEIDARMVQSSPYAAMPVDSYISESSSSGLYSQSDESCSEPVYEAISDSDFSADFSRKISLGTIGTQKSSLSNMSTGSTGRQSTTSSESESLQSPTSAKKRSVFSSIRRSLNFSKKKSRPAPVTRSKSTPATAIRSCLKGPHYEKEHNFKVANLKTNRYCHYCGNYMWGLVHQGVQCSDCGTTAHKNCSRHIPNDCCPDPKLVQKVFGVDLVSIVNLHGTVRPLVVGLVVSELERRGAYRTEGLYRENGDGSVIDKLKAQIDHSVAEVQLDQVDSYSLASLLKLYLRELPKALIDDSIVARLYNAVDLSTENFAIAVNMMKTAFDSLHPAHLSTLRFLISHLSRVESCSNVNKMTAGNLGVCFGPVICRGKQQMNATQLSEAVQEAQAQKRLVSFLIEHQHLVFTRS